MRSDITTFRSSEGPGPRSFYEAAVAIMQGGTHLAYAAELSHRRVAATEIALKLALAVTIFP